MLATDDLIRLLRLEVTIYHNAKVCGNWQIKAHDPGQTCFHIVTMGSCLLDVPGEISTSLNKGDLLIFPRELAHSMRPTAPVRGREQHLPYTEAEQLPGTGLLCAAVNFKHHAYAQLLDGMPAVLLIRNDGTTPWLQPLLALVIEASWTSRSLTTVVLDRLCELLFINALSHYLSQSPRQPGLLALHAHPRISQALSALHKQPEARWTVEAMARHAAQSRTLFARTFKALSGWTPMEYLSWWRMQLAWNHLESGMNIAEAAEKTGYRSQAAFSRAFKQCFGINAGRIKRLQGAVQSS